MFGMMGPTRKGEMYRTAEMLVNISKEQGIYFAIALLHDSQYDYDRIKELLPILKDTYGSIKEGFQDEITLKLESNK